MDHFLAILSAVPVTLLVTFAAFALGAVIALPLAGGRRSRFAVVRLLTKGVIDILRGVPPVVFVFILFFGVGSDLIRWEPLPAAIVGLGLISAGHLAEIYRGGLMAVHQGQFEASAALGLTSTTTFSRVIGPQAFRVAIPGMVTWLISLLKDSSIVSTIGVAEIMFVTSQGARSSGEGLLPFIIAGAVYIALGTPLAALSRWLEKKLSFGRRA
ncbi:MAG: amino acid ABC transporter permease [Salinibacterium sp.]|nr:amino acid ABC transporter permease [Salinibacterium sp.]MBF0671856.1 amino acid ABC transporter permease [Salinibacterium sp.]